MMSPAHPRHSSVSHAFAPPLHLAPVHPFRAPAVSPPTSCPFVPPAPAPAPAPPRRPRWSSSSSSSSSPSDSSALPPPPPGEPPDAAQLSPLLPGTPCFTRGILSTPMPRDHRHFYLSAVTASVESYLSSLSSSSSSSSSSEEEQNEVAPTPPPPPPGPEGHVAQLTLLAPQLNPELDVYDRRFLLQLVWAVARACATCRLRTRVLIQGRRVFGAVPLSVAGLRRDFDADLSLTAADWPVLLRSGELELVHDDVDDDDDVFIVVSPMNAVSIPVIDAVRRLASAARGRPVILVNPRLADVPSHSGVMQVAGRKERMHFLAAATQLFYFRLLYAPGFRFPPKGILFRAWPRPWQVWRSVDVDKDYKLILESDERPSGDEITNAFKRDAFNRRKERQRRRQRQNAADGDADDADTQADSLDALVSNRAFAIFAVVAVVAIVIGLLIKVPDPMFVLQLAFPPMQ